MAKTKQKLGNPMAVAAAGNAVGKMDKYIQYALAAGLIGGVGYIVYLVTAPLRAAGDLVDKIKDDPADTNAVQAGRNSPAFSANYWYQMYKANPKVRLWSKATTENFAKTIYDAISWKGDDEVAIYGVFDKMRSKVHSSHLAHTYFAKYKKGLYAHLEDNLSAAELAKIVNLMNARPNYVTA